MSSKVEFVNFQNSLLACNPGHINREIQACDWMFGEIQVFHERTRFPWNIFQKSSTEYWSETIYNNLIKAEEDAIKFRAKVKKSFYCSDDEPNWFLIFDEFEMAAKHAYCNLFI